MTSIALDNSCYHEVKRDNSKDSDEDEEEAVLVRAWI